MHFCDPNQLIATKQRNKLAAVNKALCYLTRGSFKEDQHTQGFSDTRLVANTGGVIMTTFDVFSSVLLPAPSPALPEAMAGATSMGGYLDTARATQLVDIVR